jgi:hypothetical protein
MEVMFKLRQVATVTERKNSGDGALPWHSCLRLVFITERYVEESGFTILF